MRTLRLALSLSFVLGLLFTSQLDAQNKKLNKVFDDEALKKQTLAAAHRLSGLSTSALHLIKQAVNEGLEKPLKAALNLEINLFEKALQNPDSREGVNAFTEKKKPRFNQAIPDA